jgi:hypothetical protein
MGEVGGLTSRVAWVAAGVACAAAVSVGCATGSEPNSDGAVGIVEQGLDPTLLPAAGGARRLIDRQYIRTIAGILGPEAAAVAAPPEEPVAGVASVQAFELPITPIGVDSFERSAVAVAAKALDFPTRLGQLAPCVTQGPNDQAFRSACYTEVAHRVGSLAFRLPPTDEAKGRLVDIGVAGEQEGTDNASRLKAGLKYVIATIIETASFVYSIEVGAPSSVAAQRNLNGFELATRLALFLTGQGPTEALLDHAAAGDLATPAGIRAAAQEILTSPDARAGLNDQLDELFQLKQVSIKGKDKLKFPQFDAALAADMREEVQRFVQDIVFDHPRSFLNLLFEEERFVSSRLATNVYNITPPAHEWDLVDFSTQSVDQQRAGILTMPALLSVFSHPVLNSPTRRGLFVTTQLFCGTVDPPPPSANTSVPPPVGGTLRQQMEAHRSNSFCASCHVWMDPLGFAFENFDALGSYRTVEVDAMGTSFPIDATGTGINTINGHPFADFNGPREFSASIVDPVHDVSRCWLDQVYRNGVGATPNSGQDALLTQLDTDFVNDNYSFLNLLLAFVSSQAFTQVGPPR